MLQGESDGHERVDRREENVQEEGHIIEAEDGEEQVAQGVVWSGHEVDYFETTCFDRMKKHEQMLNSWMT